MDRAKMILNELYRRLGIKPYQDVIEIVNSSRAKLILSKFIVKEQYNLTDKLDLYQFETLIKKPKYCKSTRKMIQRFV